MSSGDIGIQAQSEAMVQSIGAGWSRDSVRVVGPIGPEKSEPRRMRIRLPVRS